MPEEPDPKKSILQSVKKALGIQPDYDIFDQDIIMHINSSFATLNQLGVGPEEGFSIEDDSQLWDEYTDNDPLVNSVKTYVYIFVRLLFDPPSNSFGITAMEKQKEEIGWRLNMLSEVRKNT